MSLPSVLYFCSFLIIANGFSQNNAGKPYFGKELYIGITGTHIYNTQNVYHKHHEFTLGTQVGMSFSKSISGGAQVLSIYTTGTHVSSEYFFLKGLYTQYDFLKKKVDRFYAELSYSYGDYCTCGDVDPFRENGISYIGVGIGGDLALGEKGIYVSGAFVSYYIVNLIEQKYNYNIYKIGLKYKFVRM